MLAMLRAKACDAFPAESEILAFCEGLNGHTWNRPRRLNDEPDLTPLPEGYGGVEVVDSRDGVILTRVWQIGEGDGPIRFGDRFTVLSRRVTIDDVQCGVHSLATEEVTAWRSTRQLPSATPGLLRLEVDIDTRPREQLLGEELPESVRATLRKYAPTR